MQASVYVRVRVRANEFSSASEGPELPAVFERSAAKTRQIGRKSEGGESAAASERIVVNAGDRMGQFDGVKRVTLREGPCSDCVHPWGHAGCAERRVISLQSNNCSAFNMERTVPHCTALWCMQTTELKNGCSKLSSYAIQTEDLQSLPFKRSDKALQGLPPSRHTGLLQCTKKHRTMHYPKNFVVYMSRSITYLPSRQCRSLTVRMPKHEKPMSWKCSPGS